ncbi:MAG: hypothetical protein KBS66_07465 [Eubacterium sp.]|nr:hypothetical protein [Candidatus Colimonas fimequi]
MSVEISLLISIVLFAISCTNFFIGRKQDTKKEVEESASLKEGILKCNLKLDQICSTTNETRSDIKSMNNKIQDIDSRVLILENDAKAMWRRIDELKDSREK